MAGLVSTGQSYKTKALSGFIRESELEEKQRQEEETLKAQGEIQETNQRTQLAGVGAGIGATVGGAAIGTAYGGPIGAVVGAGLGYLFATLF